MHRFLSWVRLSKQIYKGSWRLVWLTIIVCVIVTVSAPLLTPILSTNLINAISNNNNQIWSIVLASAIVIMIILFAAYVLTVFSDGWFTVINNKSTAEVLKKVFVLPFHEVNEKYAQGDVFNRAIYGCSGSVGVFALGTQLVSSLVCAIILIIMLSELSFTFVLLAIGISAVEVIRMVLESKYNYKYQSCIEIANSKKEAALNFTVSNVESLLVTQTIDIAKDNWINMREEYWKCFFKKVFFNSAINLLFDGLYGLIRISMYTLLFDMYTSNTVSIGGVGSSSFIFENYRSNIANTRFTATELPMCFVPIERMEDLLNTKRELSLQYSEDVPVVELREVSAILTNKLILNSINISINSGEHIGIIGSNGSGKSTLVKLVLGLIPASSGKLFSICSHKNQDKWSEVASYIPAMPYTFAMTGKENIELSGYCIREELLDKYSFLLQNVQWMSSGQQQQVNILRGIQGNKVLVVADEPTSSLDESFAKDFFDMIISNESTTLVISHDPKFLPLFDKICLLENGCVVQFDVFDVVQRTESYHQWLGSVSCNDE